MKNEGPARTQLHSYISTRAASQWWLDLSLARTAPSKRKHRKCCVVYTRVHTGTATGRPVQTRKPYEYSYTSYLVRCTSQRDCFCRTLSVLTSTAVLRIYNTWYRYESPITAVRVCQDANAHMKQSFAVVCIYSRSLLLLYIDV